MKSITFNRYVKYSILAIIAVMAMCNIAAASDIVTVKVETPEVMTRSDKEAKWATVEKEITAKPGTEIATNFEGQATLTWFEGNVVRLYPLTLLEITSAEEIGQARKSELKLEKGSLLARVPKLKDKESEFIIRTPTTVTGVRGTAFQVTIASDNITIVTAIEDSVYVISEQIEVVLDPGFVTYVEPGEPPAEPIPVPEVQLEDLQEKIKEITPLEEDAAVPEETPDHAAEESSNDAADNAADEAAEAAQESVQDVIEETIDDTIDDAINNIEEHFPY